MADNYVAIRIKANDDAKPDLTDLKAKLDELSHKVATARAQVDSKQADAALTGLDLKLKRIADKVVNPKITMRGADRALADLLAVDVAMDRLSEKTDRLEVKADTEAAKGGLLARMLGGMGGGLSGAGGGIPGLGGLAGSSPYAAGGVFGGLIASAPFVGQLLASGIVGGLGAGLAGIGIAGALDLTKNKKGKDVIGSQEILKAFDKLKTDANKDLQEIGRPFQPVLANIARTADAVLKPLTPVFAAAEKMIAGPLQQFADTFLKAFDQPSVKESILAIGNAFSALVSAVTPQLPNDFRMIANAITAIANNVAANPQAFSGFINFLVKAAVYALNTINALTAAANFIERDFVPAMLIAGEAAITFAQKILRGMHTAADVALTAFGVIVDGAAKAFGWVPGVGPKLQGAAKEFDSFRASVDSTFAKANRTLDGWKHNLDTTQKKVTLKGDITDLQNKLRTAENQLKDPNLTKDRKAHIKAEIAQMEAQLAKARSELSAINGMTAIVHVGADVAQVLQSNMPTHAAGGVAGAAAGGVRGGLHLVGEHGPELVRIPAGSTVHSNPDTQRMLAAAGGGSRHYTINVNVPPNVNMAEVGRVTVQAIREFERGSGKSWRS